MRDNPIRVLIVDDNVLVVEGVRMKIKREPSLEWVGHLPNADDLIVTALRRRPDVVLLDIDMPGRNAFEALAHLRELFPQIRVVMLSGHVRRELIDRAVESGAWGYVAKTDGVEAIICAIRRVAAGEFALGPEVAATYQGR